MVTHSHPAKQALKKSLSLTQLQGLQAVLDVHAIVSITDVKGNITYVNDKFCDITGFSRQELLGKNHRIVKSETHPESFFREMWRTLAQGGTWQGMIENIKKDGSSYWVQTTIMPLLNEQGKPEQYISIRTDISERQRMNIALESLTVAASSQRVFFKISQAVAQALDCRWAGVGRLVENGRRIEMLGFWDTDHEAELLSYDLAGTPCAEVCFSRQPRVFSEHVAEQFPDDKVLLEMGAVSYRGLCLADAAGKSIGVLMAFDDKPCLETSTDDALLRVAAERAALELQRMAVETALAARKDELFRMLDRVSDGFFSLTEEWRFSYLNQTASMMFSTSWKTVKDQIIWDVLPEVASFFFKPLKKAMREQTMMRTEGYYPPLSRWFVVHIYPSPEGVSVYLQDVTEHREVQEERRRMEERMQQTQKMEAVGQLTAGIAHDFNNILASIIGYTDLAMTRCMGEGQEKLEEYLGQVYSAGERARDLIQQMLSFSRTTGSQVSPLNPTPLIKETVKMLKSTLPASIHLQFEYPRDETLLIRAEPVQLQQLVMNLCINARDAMRAKGELTVRLVQRHYSGEVCASCHASILGNYVALVVEDNGQGMDVHTLKHLFEPFFTTKEVGSGSGLGLSVVHGIMHDYHGHICVDSTPGKGTCFQLLFKQIDSEQIESKQKDLQQTVSKDTQQTADGDQCIMVVDDEASIIGFMQAWLSQAGYRVQGFTDSRAALQYFQQHPDDVDLLITDQTMPVLNGLELVKAMLAVRPQLPVILCSGYSEMMDREAAEGIGVKHFVSKPYDRDPMLAVINTLLMPSQ